MGWLDCNPDEIYVHSKFVLYDLPEYLPGPLADFSKALSRYIPTALAQSLGNLSITARPMQVGVQRICRSRALPCSFCW